MGLDQYMYPLLIDEEKINTLTAEEVEQNAQDWALAKAYPFYKSTGFYLRKCNALHNYIAEHAYKIVRDDIYMVISRDALEEFCKVASLVLNKEDVDPKEVLPTCEGFFFGSTEYDDDYYLYQVGQALDEVDGLLKDYPHTQYFFYHAWY